MTITLDEGKAALLRKPFTAESIGKLPRSTCKACSDSQRKRCDQHQWVPNCPECHGSHSSATMHLDYVGHAATTDRLLQVDPLWSWEPMVLDPQGFPGVDRDGNLWIRLTVCGKTGLGVGDGRNAKERIGDAIRNAAMRFGVALDLWSKDELEQVSGVNAERLRSAVAAELASRTQTGGDEVGSQTSAGEPGDSPVQAAQREVGAKLEAERQARIAERDTAPTPPDEVPRADSPLLNTSGRLARRMFALFGEIGLTQKADRLAYVADVIKRPIESSVEMTDADAERVCAAIEHDLQQPFPPKGADQ